jgi:Phage Tail Collar Domain
MRDPCKLDGMPEESSLPPSTPIWQRALYALFTTALGIVAAVVTTRYVAKSSVTEAVRSEDSKDLITKQVKISVQEQALPIVGEIRAFSFGGERGDPYIEELRRLGWLECAGQSIARTPNTQELFDKLNPKQTWGKSGDRIRVPDLRGTFLRGWLHGGDPAGDPDINARVIPPGSSNKENNSVGTRQPDALMNHTHAESVSGDASHGLAQFGIEGKSYAAANPSYLATSGPLQGAGQETRPKNVYVMYCIYLGKTIGPNDIDYGDTPNK